MDDHEISKPLSDVWRQIQGCSDWKGLLDPMDSHLRREVIRYGEFSQACYDSFDFDPHSKYCGTCKYTGGHFFEKLDMADRGYHLSRYGEDSIQFLVKETDSILFEFFFPVCIALVNRKCTYSLPLLITPV